MTPLIKRYEAQALELGLKFDRKDHEAILRHVLQYDAYVIAAKDMRLVVEAVQVDSNGDFICLMVDTEVEQPISYITQNFDAIAAMGDLSASCETLEIERRAYFGQAQKEAA